MLYAPDLLEDTPKDVLEKIPQTEKVLISLKGGAFNEWLICTDRQLYIIKKGFFTGNTFGCGVFQLPYQNVTGVNVTFHLIQGYFEVITGGVPMRTRTDYSQPYKLPNCIYLNSRTSADRFQSACNFINEKATQARTPVSPAENPSVASSSAQSAPSTDGAALLEKLADLHKRGILTDEEFQQKKADILSKI